MRESISSLPGRGRRRARRLPGEPRQGDQAAIIAQALAESLELHGGNQLSVGRRVAPREIVLAAIEGIVRIAGHGVPVPGDAELHAELLGGLVHVGSESPAVAAVVEGPIAICGVQ